MRRFFIGIVISVVCFAIFLLTLPAYGINWDSPDHWLRGQAILQFFLTGKKEYGFPKRTPPIFIHLNEYASRYYFTPSENGTKTVLPPDLTLQTEFQDWQKRIGRTVSFYEDDSWNGKAFVDQDGPGHLPFVDILAAFSNRIFYQHVHLIGDIESYELVYMLFASFGVFVVYLFTYEITQSVVAGLIASACLLFFPVFFAEAHFNMKDPIQASLFAGSVWSFWHFVREGKKRWFILFTLLVSFALGVKWNIVFLPGIILPWLFIVRHSPEFRRWFTKKLFVYALLFSLFTIFFMIIIWPYSWTNPISSLFGVANFYIDFGGKLAPFEPTGFLLPLGVNTYPLLLLVTQTPEIILLLLGIGIFALVRKYRKEHVAVGYLLLFWLIVPLARLLVPHAGFYGGIRQFMEILPAMAIIAGIGGGYIYKTIFNFQFPLFKKRATQLVVCSVLLGAIFVGLCIPIMQFHPNENVYFNSLTGGISGAAKNNLVDWSVTFGNVYKQGVDWLNAHAESHAHLAHIDGSNFAISPLWLRQDISYSPDNFSGLNQKGEYIMTLFNPLDPPSFASRYPKRFLKPVHIVYSDGFPLLFIYKNSHEYATTYIAKQQGINVLIQPVKADPSDYLELDLGKDLSVTQIRVKAPASCLKAASDSIALVPEEKAQFTQIPESTYLLQETKDDGNGEVAFFFPAETARFIFIRPQTSKSCFINAPVALVSFLP